MGGSERLDPKRQGPGGGRNSGIISLLGRVRSSPVPLRWNIGELRGGGGLSPALRGGEHFRVQYPVSDPGEWREAVCHLTT